MDVDELEPGDSADQHWVDLAFPAQPIDQLGHQDRNIVPRRRCVHNLSSAGVHHVILDAPVFPGRYRPTTHTLDETLVDLPNQAFGQRPTATEPGGDEFERVPVV